jgi:hypothetical protein
MEDKARLTGTSSSPDAKSGADNDVVVDSVALRRLMNEVRIEETMVGRHYNRQHNRHNR